MRHDDGNRAGVLLGSKSWFRTLDHDHINLETGECGHERREAIQFPLCIAVFDDDILTVYVPKFMQTLPESVVPASVASKSTAQHHAYARDFLLRLRRRIIAERKEHDAKRKIEDALADY
jgi:hypothetical protein